MAELVDAPDSKSGYRKVVQVRFLFWAQKVIFKNHFFSFYDNNYQSIPLLTQLLSNNLFLLVQ